MTTMPRQQAPRRGKSKMTAAVRMCVGCRGRFLKASLRCIQRRSDGELRVGRQRSGSGGRSAYLCASQKCYEVALRKRAFERAWPQGKRQMLPLEGTPALTKKRNRKNLKICFDSKELWARLGEVSTSVGGDHNDSFHTAGGSRIARQIPQGADSAKGGFQHG